MGEPVKQGEDMNDDFKPGQAQENPPGGSGEGLAGALEELIQTRQASQGHPAPEPMNRGSVEPAAAGAQCPEPGEWELLLAGEATRPAQTTKVNALLSHAAECAFCAERLLTLSADATEEESAFLSGLSSTSAEGQRKLAAELARTPRFSGGKKLPRFYVWLGAGMAASLLISVGLVSWWRIENDPERMMAAAYTHARIFDLRMPGAGFAEVTPERHLRGGSTGRESARLLEARAHIEQHLEAAPEDAHWLQLEARSDVLEEKFDPAIDILDRLMATGPVTSSLLVDDASAYFQRGTATGSENDRATALENLRKADELTPGDPVVLFNEAVAMEDRGQVMNAVETWNRYLRFERDPLWLAEGRRRLQALEQKLNQLKTHQGRMEQRLATPAAMRALAADATGLGAIDEELSTTLLPRLLNAAFPTGASRASPNQNAEAQARGSPCLENCQAARTLLYALAASIERNHQDSWLTRFLPFHPLQSDLPPIDLKFTEAAHALAQAIDEDARGNYLGSGEQAERASRLFHELRNAGGEERADVERANALQSMANYAGCYGVAHALLSGDAEFAWIHAEAATLDAYCDPSPGSDAEDNPAFLRAESMAHDRGYALAELRVRNMRGGAAADAGDAELAWRDYLAAIRQFYEGDYPALRLSGTLSGLEQMEQATPRAQLALLLQREVVETLELTENRQLLPTARLNLAAAAVRAGSIDEAREAMGAAQSELAANGGGKSVESILAEVETALANVYLERGQPDEAGKLLDSAYGHMAGEKNAVYLRNYAAARGQLALERGHPEAAEPVLRAALIEQERLGSQGGAGNIVLAQQNRDLYAVLAGVWLAERRPGDQVLALWERYRLRVLGIPVAACVEKRLDCLQDKVEAALKRPGFGGLLGQVVLPDRLLLYWATAQGVQWNEVSVRREDLLEAEARLERAVDSPETPEDAVDRAGRRVGELLVDPVYAPVYAVDQLGQASGQRIAGPVGPLLLERDPLLGNLPWPSVATAGGDLGLKTNLEESPSLLLEKALPAVRAPGGNGPADKAAGKALIVGAPVASGVSQLLPEVLKEAEAVAQFDRDPSVLMGNEATEPQVMAHLESAAAIHFAGHAKKLEGATRLLLAPDAEAAADRPWLDSVTLRLHPPRRARLAVFSACSSGKKEAGWDHGMGDIVATLASLGVPDVVATRWQIDSGAAVPMMDAFYGGLAKGLTVPQALTAARQFMVRDPRYRHPYYWAAWYASGSGTADLSGIFHAN